MEAVYNKFVAEFVSEDFDGSEWKDRKEFAVETGLTGKEAALRAFAHTDDPTVYFVRVYNTAGDLIGEAHIDEAIIDIEPTAIYDGAYEAAKVIRGSLEDGWFGKGRIGGLVDFDGTGHFKRIYYRQFGNMNLKVVDAKEWLRVHEAELARFDV